VVILTLIDASHQTPLRQWRFTQVRVIKVGRAPDNQVVLDDGLVSRYHLELRQIGGASESWQFVNQGKNGTLLNGVLVAQGLITAAALLQLSPSGPVLQVQVELGVQGAWAAPHGQPIAGEPPMPPCTHAGNSPQNLFCNHCGQPIKVERLVRHYQILRTLGQGGMGTTYLAFHEDKGIGLNPNQPQGNALLVLKEMNADMAQVAKAQELFEREARTLKVLQHQGIPRFYDFFVEDGKKYLAMELIQGQDLEKRVYQQGVVPLQQAIGWMIQTCEVLHYLHSQNPPIIHRDIKPANLMTRYRDNSICVLDFGAVKEIGTPFGTRIGAEGYSAPEQDRGRPSTQSDLYAIGPTLTFLLSGQIPQNFYRKCEGNYRFKVDGLPAIPAPVQAVIEKVTEPQASDRYQTATELAQELRQCT